jgi:hypothetical protein
VTALLSRAPFDTELVGVRPRTAGRLLRWCAVRRPRAARTSGFRSLSRPQSGTERGSGNSMTARCAGDGYFRCASWRGGAHGSSRRNRRRVADEGMLSRAGCAIFGPLVFLDGDRRRWHSLDSLASGRRSLLLVACFPYWCTPHGVVQPSVLAVRGYESACTLKRGCRFLICAPAHPARHLLSP